jgi:hypothetical protein
MEEILRKTLRREPGARAPNSFLPPPLPLAGRRGCTAIPRQLCHVRGSSTWRDRDITGWSSTRRGAHRTVSRRRGAFPEFPISVYRAHIEVDATVVVEAVVMAMAVPQPTSQFLRRDAAADYLKSKIRLRGGAHSRQGRRDRRYARISQGWADRPLYARSLGHVGDFQDRCAAKVFLGRPGLMSDAGSQKRRSPFRTRTGLSARPGLPAAGASVAHASLAVGGRRRAARAQTA